MSFMTNTWKWKILLDSGRILFHVQNIASNYGKMAFPGHILCDYR